MGRPVIWSTEARADIRAIDGDTALRLLKALDRFLKTDAGNVKQLDGFDPLLFRLRVGDWRADLPQAGRWQHRNGAGPQPSRSLPLNLMISRISFNGLS
jgi:hypothetical protein